METQNPRGVRHFFTVDVEEHFQVAAFEPYLTRGDWSSQPGRVEASTQKILDLLARHHVRGTFFTLGWVAERYPDLVRRMAAEGHEIASHSWWHQRVHSITPEAFREELRSSKGLLEDLIGAPVLGFRAPNFSIVPGVEWAFDVLLEEGYRYDSSVFPLGRRGYGYAAVPHHPFMIRRSSGDLLEVPIAMRRYLGIPIPAAGGGYFRVLPAAVARWTFRHYTRTGRPGCFYIHPWEVDPDQPRMEVGPLARARHYSGLQNTLSRMDRLLSEFDFTSIADAYFPGERLDTAGLDVVALAG